MISDRQQGWVPQDIDLCRSEHRDVIHGDVVNEPHTRAQPEEVQEPHNFGIVLLNLVLEIFFANNVHERADWRWFRKS